MQIIDIKGKKWVVGLEWEILPGEISFKVEAKEVAEKTNSNFGILIDYDQQFAIGLSKKTSKLPSAATYLALANQEARSHAPDNDFNLDWILVEDAGDDKFWIAVIKNGIPSPQYDAILDITSIKDRITELLINDTFRLFSTCGEIKAIFEGMKLVEDGTLNTLTQEVKTKLTFTKLRGIPDSLIYTAVGIMVVGALLYGGISFIEGRNLKEKAANFEKQRKKEELQKKKQYDADLQQYEQGKELAKNQAITGVLSGMATTPSTMLSAWYDMVGSIELGTHGWNLDSIECYVAEPVPDTEIKSACDIKFIRNPLATNRMLLQEYPSATIKGNEALVTRPVLLDKTKVYVKPAASINSLPTANAWGFDMISQLQLLKVVNIDHDIKPSVDITFNPPPKPVTPELAANGAKPTNEGPQSIGVAKGEIIIKNNNIDLIREVADNVEFSGIGARKAAFKIQGLGSIAWEVTLDYFVRADSTGGIAGGNSESLNTDPNITPNQPPRP